MHRQLLMASATSVAAGLLLGGASVLMGHHFVEEFTRPGKTIPRDALDWGGWGFPVANEPPAEFRRSLSFQARDGTTLQGEFWAQPHPAPTVVLSHGFRLSRAQFRPVAAVEYQHGYNVLLFDYRGHGESMHVPTTGGIAEVRDLAAAVHQAILQPETSPRQVYIHGFSMGAAVALLLPPQPEVAGIIADSPFARLDEMLHRIVTWQLTSQLPERLRLLKRLIPLGSCAAILGARLIFRVRFRHELVARPEYRLRHHNPQRAVYHPPILLIHSSGDPLIPSQHTRRLALAARASGISVTTYIVDSQVHCGAYGADPAAYSQQLIDFLQHCQDRES